MLTDQYQRFLFVVIAAFLLVGCQGKDTEVQAQSANGNESSDAPLVEMVEYSDYQCPACAYFHPMVEKLKAEYGDELQVTYKYFPLNMHQYAMLAARAAESARQQGKFIEMHNMLFENQQQWSESSNPQPLFVKYAREIGLDVGQFENDLNAASTQQAVVAQKREGENQGVTSTPSFYINDEAVSSLPRTYEQFKSLVDVYMEEAKNGQTN